jgi:two-component system cell cycle sensor histidine kinase/response regulator CckA
MSSESSRDTHSLLARQLRHSQVDPSSLDDATKKLLEAVNSAYEDFDSTRQMLERSLELSSQELRQANAELRVLLAQRDAAEKEMATLHAQRLEATGLLAGGVAHDFNNLLAVIKGSCDVLMAMIHPADSQREIVRQIETASARAAALTRQLLIFSRRQVLTPRVIDLNRTIAGLEHIYQPLVGRDIELRWALDPKLPNINADPAQIEQVLINLIVNARDAMPAGGTLELQTTRASPAETRAHGAGGAALVRLSVKDTGAGMSTNVKSRIFEPFFTTKAPGKGTGLGLSTVYGIVRQSGGFITVDSEIEKGTTFHVFLPESERAPGPP